jgi:hypothetical protein
MILKILSTNIFSDFLGASGTLKSAYEDRPVLPPVPLKEFEYWTHFHEI